VYATIRLGLSQENCSARAPQRRRPGRRHGRAGTQVKKMTAVIEARGLAKTYGATARSMG